MFLGAEARGGDDVDKDQDHQSPQQTDRTRGLEKKIKYSHGFKRNCVLDLCTDKFPVLLPFTVCESFDYWRCLL